MKYNITLYRHLHDADWMRKHFIMSIYRVLLRGRIRFDNSLFFTVVNCVGAHMHLNLEAVLYDNCKCEIILWKKLLEKLGIANYRGCMIDESRKLFIE